MEYVHGFLSSGIIGRLCLCPRSNGVAWRAPSSRNAYGVAFVSSIDLADCSSERRVSTYRRKPDSLAADAPLDIGGIALLRGLRQRWVAPLAIYLLTFILAFARKPIVPHLLMIRAMPILLLPLVLWILLGLQRPLWLFLLQHLLTFFVTAMVCHGELIKSRPHTQHLTEFYMWISLGGFLGGLFNALNGTIPLQNSA